MWTICIVEAIHITLRIQNISAMNKALYTVLWYYSYLDSSGFALQIQIAIILLK